MLYGESEQQSFLGNVTSHTSDCCGRFPTRLWVEVGRASVLEVTPSAVRCNRTDSGAPRVKILSVGCPQPSGNTVKFSHENSSKSSPSQESEPSVRGCVLCGGHTKKGRRKSFAGWFAFCPKKRKTERRNIWQFSSID